MYVRDIMTTDVITIPANTSIINAKRIMREHKFRRLPVVDGGGKLVGIVTEADLEKVSPPGSASPGVWEFSYNVMSIFGTQVREVMKKKVVTVTPGTTVEEAVAVAQANKVGALVVVEDDRVVGIVTTNDFFYRIVNKVLGVGEPGVRIQVTGGGEGKALEEVISLINKHGLRITTLHIIALPQTTKKDVVAHVDCEDASRLISELTGRGYEVALRKRC